MGVVFAGSSTLPPQGPLRYALSMATETTSHDESYKSYTPFFSHLRRLLKIRTPTYVFHLTCHPFLDLLKPLELLPAKAPFDR